MNDRQTESEDLNFIVIKFVNCTRTHARTHFLNKTSQAKEEKQRTKNKEQELTNKLTTIIKQFNYS